MTAKERTTPFTTNSEKGMCDEVQPDYAQKLAAACERFAPLLRTTPVEATKTSHHDIRHVLFCVDERLLWTTTLESQWHRYLCKAIDPSTIQ